jgi:hypothetical protein
MPQEDENETGAIATVVEGGGGGTLLAVAPTPTCSLHSLSSADGSSSNKEEGLPSQTTCGVEAGLDIDMALGLESSTNPKSKALPVLYDVDVGGGDKHALIDAGGSAVATRITNAAQNISTGGGVLLAGEGESINALANKKNADVLSADVVITATNAPESGGPPNASAATTTEDVVVVEKEDVPLFVGDTVSVEHDYSPGINIVGGTGKITKVNDNGTFSIMYFVGGGDRNVERGLMTKTNIFEQENTRKSRADQDPGRGRCGHCNSFLRDCTCANSIRIARRAAPTTEEMARKSANADGAIMRMKRRKKKKNKEKRRQYLDSSSEGGDSSNSDFGDNAGDLEFGPETVEDSDDDDEFTYIPPAHVFRPEKDRQSRAHQHSGRIPESESGFTRKKSSQPSGRILEDDGSAKRHKSSNRREGGNSRKRKRNSRKNRSNTGGGSSKPCWLTIDGIPSACENASIRAMFSTTVANNIMRIKRRNFGLPNPTVAISFRNKFVAQKAHAECNGMQCGEGWVEATVVLKLAKSNPEEGGSKRSQNRTNKVCIPSYVCLPSLTALTSLCPAATHTNLS